MGPAEHALSQLISSISETRAPKIAPEAVILEPAKPALGDFRLDLRPLMGNDAHNKSACQDIAALIKAANGIDKAIAIPPRIYIRASLDLLYEEVVGSILSQEGSYGSSKAGEGKRAIVTFSDPNANKPLHLGHLRNNFLGMALGRLLENAGYLVERHATLSDWGIHICQSLVAYMRWGEGRTPKLEGVKGDHFVGRFYVMFHQRAADVSSLEEEALDALKRIESGDEELIALVETLTRWAEEGIDETYGRIGSRFDEVFREREYLLVARQAIEKALQTGACTRRQDDSVCVDLSDLGLGEITLIRSDGSTTVYSQIMGIDIARFERPLDKVLSIFGHEWEAGATSYVEAVRRFGHVWTERYEPIFYGMITLPDGRMRSREGTVIAADQLLDDLRDRLKMTIETEVDGVGVEALALGLLKYYLLRTGRNHTLPYSEAHLWRNVFPRFMSIIRLLERDEDRSSREHRTVDGDSVPKNSRELRELLLQLNGLPRAASRAVEDREPAEVVRFLDGLCGKAERLARVSRAPSDFSMAVELTARRALELLNIAAPESLDSVDLAQLIVTEQAAEPSW